MKPLLAAAVLLALLASGCGGGTSADNTIAIGVHHSKFDPEVITVRAAEVVTITLKNSDPIEHEWIVGAADVHERHRNGTEPYHDTVPTEVTLPPLSEKTTNVTFATPGEYQYVCHLPGHEAYGMRGVIRVR